MLVVEPIPVVNGEGTLQGIVPRRILASIVSRHSPCIRPRSLVLTTLLRKETANGNTTDGKQQRHAQDGLIH